ncbi:MAG: NAD(P)H-hydrate dehydratase [Thermoanaerobaculales bacterium]|nr:NAD(P)H-hydrate dehydratase [Thermoanaerobaculales bacterium]
MLPVVDNDAIREADRHTIEDLGVPSLVLMENAATGLVDAVREKFPAARHILILCGPGNNGGDGLAAARHFANGGHRVRILLLADPNDLSRDAAKNLELARAFALDLTIVPNDDIENVRSALQGPTRPDIVIDALLGTGLARPLGGRLARVSEMLGEAGIPIVAVDVPTGLNGSRAQIPGPAVHADLTVTFGALKICHTLPPACELCGEIAVVDIGIPPSAVESNSSTWWVEAEDIALMLPNRAAAGHKGTFGHLLLVAGAKGRGGAAAMAAKAAVAGGSGLVTVAVPDPVLSVVDGACLEAMTLALPADGDSEAAGPGSLQEVFPRMSAVAAGPGLGTNGGARETVMMLIDDWVGPLLLDADGINLLSGHPERLAHHNGPTVLTPHPGELGRLLDRPTSEVIDDRLAAAREAAKRSGAVVVAKGYRTIIADPEGRAWIIPTGDHHLGTGGSGDVLTGLLGALLAQGLDPARAALVGCWLHGRAGELGGESWPAAVPASELPSLVAAAWSELEQPDESQ